MEKKLSFIVIAHIFRVFLLNFLSITHASNFEGARRLVWPGTLMRAITFTNLYMIVENMQETHCTDAIIESESHEVVIAPIRFSRTHRSNPSSVLFKRCGKGHKDLTARANRDDAVEHVVDEVRSYCVLIQFETSLDVAARLDRTSSGRIETAFPSTFCSGTYETADTPTRFAR